MDTVETDDNDDYEEEECLVYLDFDTKFLEDQLRDPNLKMDIIGIDTDNPILQVNSKLFKGTYDYAMGTNVFFTETRQPLEPDPNYREMPDRTYEYFGSTNKVLKMKRIFVEERDKIQDEHLDAEIPETLVNLRVTKTYGDALNQFLHPLEQPPRHIEDDEIPIEGDVPVKRKLSKDDGDDRLEEMSTEFDLAQPSTSQAANMDIVDDNTDVLPKS